MATRSNRRTRSLGFCLAANALLLAACSSASTTITIADASPDVAQKAPDAAADATPKHDAGRKDAAADASKPDAVAHDAGSDVATLDAGSKADTSPPIDAAKDVGVDAAPVCEPRTYAVNSLQFGDGNSGQWKALGFNIDGLISTATDTNLCQPSNGGSATEVYPDGNNGIDNSFGKNLLPLLLSVDPTLASDANSDIQSGLFSNLFETSCSSANPALLPTKFFVATQLASTPKFDGTDVWPVAPEFLSDTTDADSSTLLFSNATVTGALFDSGKNQTLAIRFPITIGGMTAWITLKVYAAEVQMTFAADRKTATGGVIGGVLNTQELVDQLELVGSELSLCGSSFNQLVTTVEQASDILSDGTQDPTMTCDGISIGLGFTVTEDQRGAVGDALPDEGTCNIE